MGSHIKYLNLKCNWNVVGHGDIDDIVIYQEEHSLENEKEITTNDNSTALAGCSLQPETNDDGTPSTTSCTLYIQSRPPQYNFCVSAIDVLCTARHMELYSGSHEEYMTTCHGMFVQEMEMKHLYLLQHTFDSPSSNFTLKFRSLDVSELWIHRIYITLVQGPAVINPAVSMLMGPSINLSKVKEFTEGSTLPDGAQQLMSLMENHTKTSQNKAAPLANLGMMMNIFSQMSMQTPQTPCKNEEKDKPGLKKSQQRAEKSDNLLPLSERRRKKPHSEIVRQRDERLNNQLIRDKQQEHQLDTRCPDDRIEDLKPHAQPESETDKHSVEHDPEVGGQGDNNCVSEASSTFMISSMEKRLDEKLQSVQSLLLQQMQRMILESEQRICNKMEMLFLNSYKANTPQLELD